jgi:RNA polymerase sigma-70 factor (ECF subfamily)
MGYAMAEAAGREDVALLRDAAAGEPKAVRRLLDDVAPIVYGFVFARVAGNEPVAEDLVQETFVEAMRSASSFRGDSALSTWLCAIARRRLARHYEAERRQEATQHGLRLVGDGGETGDEDEVDRHDEVVRALARLSAAHRQVLVMKYLDDRSVNEIAAELGRNSVQVQSLLQRARDALRRELADEDQGR